MMASNRCHVCGQLLSSPANLRRHLKRCHDIVVLSEKMERFVKKNLKSLDLSQSSDGNYCDETKSESSKDVLALADSINRHELDIVQKVSACGDEIKRRLRSVDFLPAELCDHMMAASVPRDVVEEKIIAIITDFVTSILSDIKEAFSESLARLRKSASFTPTVEVATAAAVVKESQEERLPDCVAGNTDSAVDVKPGNTDSVCHKKMKLEGEEDYGGDTECEDVEDMPWNKKFDELKSLATRKKRLRRNQGGTGPGPDGEADEKKEKLKAPSHKSKPHRCVKCGRSYIGKAGIARHYRLHPDHEPEEPQDEPPPPDPTSTSTLQIAGIDDPSTLPPKQEAGETKTTTNTSTPHTPTIQRLSSSIRGNPAIIVDGYKFTFQRHLKHHIYFKCNFRCYFPDRCTARVKTDLTMSRLLSTTGDHNHGPHDTAGTAQSQKFFTDAQRDVLWEKFAANSHPDFEEMIEIAAAIGDQVDRVTTWFKGARNSVRHKGSVYTKYRSGKELPSTARTCPVCKVTSGDLGNDTMMKSHLATHLIYDVAKDKILTRDGQEWNFLTAASGDKADDAGGTNECDRAIEEESRMEAGDGEKVGLVKQDPCQNLSPDFLQPDDFLAVCQLCNVRYLNTKELRAHRLTAHKDLEDLVYAGPRKAVLQRRGKRTYKKKMCDLCGADVCETKWADHQRAHEGKTFPCDVCGIHIATAKALIRHKLIHTRKEGEQSYVCEVCGKGFWHRPHLKKHMATRHRDRAACGGQGSEAKAEFRVTCGICKTEFFSERTYHKHYREEHKPYFTDICEFCGASFRDAQFLKIHKVRRHGGNAGTNSIATRDAAGKPRLTCDICHKTYGTTSGLRLHVRSTHNRERAQCDICHKSFIHKHSLRLHKNQVHSDRRPHKCDVCPMAFKLPGALQAHRTIHTGEKPFQCDVCHQRFRMRKFLDSHYRIHTGEKPYVCQVCGQAFRQKGDHTKHLKRHADRGECSLVKTTTSTNMTTYSLQMTDGGGGGGGGAGGPVHPQPPNEEVKHLGENDGGRSSMGSEGGVGGAANIVTCSTANIEGGQALATKMEEFDGAKVEPFHRDKMESFNVAKTEAFDGDMRHLGGVHGGQVMGGYSGSTADSHIRDLGSNGVHIGVHNTSGHIGGHGGHIGVDRGFTANSGHVSVNHMAYVHMGLSSMGQMGQNSVSHMEQTSPMPHMVHHNMPHIVQNINMHHMEHNSGMPHIVQNNNMQAMTGSEVNNNNNRLESPHLSPLCLAVVGGGGGGSQPS